MMLPQPLRRAFGALVVLVLALGLGLAGSRHHVTDPETAAAQAAFLMAGGDLADICGDVGTGSHPDCPLCHLVATVGLSDPSSLLRDADLRLVAEIVLPSLTYAARAAHDPASPAQGPPTV
jgi:hypothetical protein